MRHIKDATWMSASDYEIEPQLSVSVSLNLRVLVVPLFDEKLRYRVRVIAAEKGEGGRYLVVLAPGRCGGFVASVCFPDRNFETNNGTEDQEGASIYRY